MEEMVIQIYLEMHHPDQVQVLIGLIHHHPQEAQVLLPQSAEDHSITVHPRQVGFLQIVGDLHQARLDLVGLEIKHVLQNFFVIFLCIHKLSKH